MRMCSATPTLSLTKTQSWLWSGDNKNPLDTEAEFFSCLREYFIQLESFHYWSLLKFSFMCWFYGFPVKDLNSLKNIVYVCSNIAGVQLTDSSSLWKKQMIYKAKRILSQSDHILSQEFSLLPSGWHCLAASWKTNDTQTVLSLQLSIF